MQGWHDEGQQPHSSARCSARKCTSGSNIKAHKVWFVPVYVCHLVALQCRTDIAEAPALHCNTQTCLRCGRASNPAHNAQSKVDPTPMNNIHSYGDGHKQSAAAEKCWEQRALALHSPLIPCPALHSALLMRPAPPRHCTPGQLTRPSWRLKRSCQQCQQGPT